jgi:hypothetical protein
MINIAGHARALLGDNSYVVLGTADADGRPWVTPVWFAPDGLDRLYWLSWPGARHSQLVEQRPEIAVTVFDSTVAPHEGAAFYATANARRCPQDDLDEALTIVNRRSVSQGLDAWTVDRVSSPARLRLYVAVYTDRWVLDQDADVDQRVPLAPGG